MRASLTEDLDAAQARPGRRRAPGPGPERRDRPPGGRWRAPVRRGLRQAAGRRGRQARRDAGRAAEPTDYQPAARPAGEGRRGARSGRARRAGLGVCGRRTPTLWTGADEAELAGLARGRPGRDASICSAGGLPGRGEGRRLRPCRAAGHGRVEPGPRSAGPDLRRAARAFPTCWSWTPPTPPRSAGSKPRSIRRTTLFIVASKSGSTLEPDMLHRHFFDGRTAALGEAEASRHFIAVTDPGSQLEETAKRAAFRRIFHGDPKIGGRYSVLTNFGMVPAAVIGLDLGALPAREPGHGARVRRQRPAGRQSWRPAGRRAGRRGEGRSRQGHHPGVRRDRRPGRLAGAIARRVHRQGRQGPYPRRRRAVRRVGRLWRGPAVRRHSARGRRPRRNATRSSRPSRTAATRSCASRWPAATRSDRSSSAGRWPRRSPAR